MKTPAEIRAFLAMMSEHDKEIEKQFREEIKRKFPEDITFPDFSDDYAQHVNYRCVIEPTHPPTEEKGGFP